MEMHAYEMQTYKMQAFKRHARERDSTMRYMPHEIYALVRCSHPVSAHEIYTSEMHAL